MFPQVYYVVNTGNGWDNVIGAYTSREEAEKLLSYMGDPESCLVRQISLENKFVEE
jgi:hypothetical protein